MIKHIEITSLQMRFNGTTIDVAYAVNEHQKRSVGPVVDNDADPAVFDTEFAATVFARSLRRFRKAQQQVREG